MLVSHFPLTREPTRILKYPEFAQWCGTERTADWHLRFSAQAVVYGHLHIPGTSWQDGVRFEEVSLGYPGGTRPEPGPAARPAADSPGRRLARRSGGQHDRRRQQSMIGDPPSAQHASTAIH